MFKLMLADDNRYILKALCNIIDWEDYDMQLIGAFLNGKDLLEAATREVPDVVITDISMPVLDGINLASTLRELSENIKIIFVSSYADFEYAQKALQMKISGYILKPFDEEQLMSIMKKVLQELKEESFRRFEKERFRGQAEYYRILALESYSRELLYHSEENQLVCQQLSKLGITVHGEYEIRVVQVVFCADIGERYNEIMDRIRSIVLNTSQNDGCMIMIPISMDTRQFALLMIYQNKNMDVANLLAQLNVDIETMIGLRTVMGYSRVSNDFSVVSALYSQAKDALSLQFVERAVVGYEDVQTEPICGNSVNETGYVSKMRKFIQEHYMEKISTADVAQAVYLSASYGNQRFVAEYGCTIFDYITDCRINEAKRLLEDTKESVTMIAELVGYYERTNFYLTFKKSVGMSPSEYRKKLKKQQDKK